MLRWLLRLGFVGVVVAAAIWVWSHMNQDLDEDELDEEIPIEFEVQLDPDATVSLSSIGLGDTGVGPGADFDAEQSASSEILNEDGAEAMPTDQDVLTDDQMADDAISEDQRGNQLLTADAEVGDADLSTQVAGSLSDLQEITGIGPVLEGRLMDAGINSIADLAVLTPENLHDLGFNATSAEAWIKQAQEMTNAKQ